jgi:hypothetical protein
MAKINSYGQITFDSDSEALAYSQGKLVIRGDSLVPVGRSGSLQMIERQDDSGRKIREFTGDKSAWMNQFKAPVNYQLCISNNPEWTELVADRRMAELQAAYPGIEFIRLNGA